jgi:hypothetical protein
MAFNKQPIFTADGVLKLSVFDAPILSDLTLQSGPSPTFISDFGVTEGTLIERVTVVNCQDTINNPDSSDKLIYLCLYNGNDGTYTVYDTKFMPATTSDAFTPPAKIQWIFEGGLVLKSNNKLAIGASNNASNSTKPGDKLSVTVEGGTYTQV